jgi:TM2 domain-containing membrane protein YozV
MQRHKDKTLATALATLLGGLGVHRFYLFGWKDVWGWAHLLAAGMSLPAFLPDAKAFGDFTLLPLVLSVLVGLIEALVIGLTPDEQWDQRHNSGSGKQTDSRWPLAFLLVLTLGVGCTVLIATLARSFDLMLTGGAYG